MHIHIVLMSYIKLAKFLDEIISLYKTSYIIFLLNRLFCVCVHMSLHICTGIMCVWKIGYWLQLITIFCVINAKTSFVLGKLGYKNM